MSAASITAVTAVAPVRGISGLGADPLAPWRPGTLLQLLQAANGAWELRALDDASAQSGTGPAMPLPEPPLDDLQAGEVLVLRVTRVDNASGAAPRIELEIVDRQVPPRLTGAGVAGVRDDALLPAMQADFLAWRQTRGPVHAPWRLALPASRPLDESRAPLAPEATGPTGSGPLASRPALDWVRASVPLLARGLPPAEPFEQTVWVQTRPLSAGLDGALAGHAFPALATLDTGTASPGVSVLCAWRGQILGLELTGRLPELTLDITTASPQGLVALHRAWPQLALALARTGARVKALRFRRRVLSPPRRRDAAHPDPALLWAAAELIWAL